MSDRAIIAAAGAGRMGRGIAVTFAMAGHEVRLFDLKQRSAADFSSLREAVAGEVGSTFDMLAAIGLVAADRVADMSERITVHSADGAAALSGCEVIFEAVPETLEAKRDAFATIGAHAAADAIIASTTSTILSDDLAPMVSGPPRFINAHWLNPAFLVPLVELSPAGETAPETVDRLKAILEAIGKLPVVCKASPGFIVPRIQMLAMNEAARMVEEGIATVEDIDKATKYGFGFRFAVLGMLEFIDWGGGDILYHASNYMSGATGENRYEAPEIIKRNMREGRTGLQAGSGFLDYGAMDVDQYRRERLATFVGMLKHLDLLPKTG